MRLHVLPPSPRALKVQALAAQLGIQPEIRVLDYARSEQSSAAFAQINPNRRQPVLEDGDFVLWESNAILVYLAQREGPTEFWPAGERAQADVLRWLFWESSHWDPAWDALITERLKKAFFSTHFSGRRTGGATESPTPVDERRVAEGMQELAELCEVLNDQLRSNAWLAGDLCTVADFAVGAWLPGAEMVGVDLRAYDALARWQTSLLTLPGWRAALASLSAVSGPRSVPPS